MKKFALSLLIAAGAVFGFGATASAYPPGGVGIEVGDPTPDPGDDVTVTVNCTPGESVTVTLAGSTASAVCGVNGDIPVTVTAPDCGSGTTTGTATGDVSGSLGTFDVTVAACATDPGGGLPATGTDSTSTITYIAGGLLIAGLGMTGVAASRRRQTVDA